MEFPIIIEKDADWYFAKCPSLDWCFAQGKTYEEVMENIKDAINLNVEDRIALWEIFPNNVSINLTSVYVNLLEKWVKNYQESLQHK